MKEKFRKAFMNTALEFASLSSCKRLQVGSIVVKDDRIISIGYNGTPAGDDNCCEEDGKTKPSVLHAEANAISKLARSSESAEDSIIFITHAPCIECAKLIYQSGIKEVYFHKHYKDDSGVSFLSKHKIPVNYMLGGIAHVSRTI